MNATARTTLALVAALAAGCNGKDDDGGNGNGSGDGGSDDGGSDDGATTTGDGGSAGPLEPPATLRVDCLDVRVFGDADGSALQAQVLENAWNENVDRFDFNILVSVLGQDDATGSATYELSSGVGRTNDEQCSHPETLSGEVTGTFEAGTVAFAAGDDCSDAADASDPAATTYSVALGPEDISWAYSEQEDGAALNCTMDTARLDGVPMRALEASFTALGSRVHGELSACLLDTEGMDLCTCLVDCKPDGDVHEDCTTCPVSSVPLSELIQGINPSDRCTEIMGEPAFDLTIAFSGRVLPTVAPVCE